MYAFMGRFCVLLCDFLIVLYVLLSWQSNVFCICMYIYVGVSDSTRSRVQHTEICFFVLFPPDVLPCLSELFSNDATGPR